MTGSRHPVFDFIKTKDPFLFLHGGDFHYMDLDEEAVAERVDAFDRVFASESASSLYTNVAFAYMWDDHDMCANNQNSECEKVAEARKAYQKVIPHYELPAASLPGAPAADAEGLRDVSPYQAFTIGSVRFIITDLRSEAQKSTDEFAGSIYSDAQREWLYAELANATSYDFVVWLSSKPWVGPAEIGGDNWQGFAKDRQEVSDHIAAHIGSGPQNLLMISSDAHMIAYDDGRNTAYDSNDTHSAGFPILQSGPLHNMGSTKGGPFSEGCHTFKGEMNNQYSVVDFAFGTPDGDCATLTAYSMAPDGKSESVLFTKKLCGAFFAEEGADNTDSTCDAPYLRPTTLGLWATAGALFLVGVVAALVAYDDKLYVLKVFAIGALGCFLAVLIGLGIPLANFLVANNVQLQTLSVAAASFLVAVITVAFLAFNRLVGYEEPMDASKQA